MTVAAGGASTPETGGVSTGGPATGAGVDVAAGVGVGVGVAGGGVVQVARSIVLAWRVTAPSRASELPVTSVALVLTVMLPRASTLPTNSVKVSIVAELPTCQKTLQAWAPLVSSTRVLGVPAEIPAAVMSVPVLAWKMKTAAGSPPASSVRSPPTKMSVAEV